MSAGPMSSREKYQDLMVYADECRISAARTCDKHDRQFQLRLAEEAENGARRYWNPPEGFTRFRSGDDVVRDFW